MRTPGLNKLAFRRKNRHKAGEYLGACGTHTRREAHGRVHKIFTAYVYRKIHKQEIFVEATSVRQTVDTRVLIVLNLTSGKNKIINRVQQSVQ